MKKITFFLSALLISMMSFAGEVTISFADKAQRTEFSDEKQVWTQNGLIVTNNKAASKNAVGDYANPARFYQGSALTIECTLGNITKIVIDGNSGKPVTGIQQSIGAEATLEGNIVTVIPTAVSNSYSIANFSAQVRVNSITVTYEAGEGGETPDPTPDPEPEPDPTPDPEPEPTPDPEEPGDDVTGNPAATIAAGESASACTVNEKDGIKVGTSSKGGSMTITVPAKATALQFYAAAWKGVTGLSINITPADKVATASIELTADAGITSNTPFTLSGEATSYYYEVALNNITEETTFTVETSIAKRFVIWGVTYTAGSNEGGETPDPTPDPEPEPDPDPTPDPEEPETPVLPEGVITCAEAVAICEQTGSTATAEAYTVRGYITSIKYTWSEQYGTATFWIADTKDGGEVLQAFSCAPLTDADKVFAVGDYVELVGKLKKYNTTNEVEKGTYTHVGSTGGEGGETPEEPETPVLPEFPEGPITCAQALEVCLATGTTSTTDTYTVHGYVTKIETAYSDQYQNISFWMADTKGGEDVILAFRVKGDATVKVGDKVEVIGTLINYGGNKPEVNTGTYTILEVAEGGETPEPTPDPEEPETPVLPEGENVTFLASADKGNATDDYNQAGEFTVTKNNVSMTVTKGIATDHYRIYKNETLTITSAAGNIVAVQLTCTAAGEEKYGPGCLTADEGTYTYAGTVGTWIGNASSVVFTASSNQVRATQIVVILADGTTTGLDNITIDTNITKTIVNGQLIIIKNGVKYNVAGAVVK